MSVIVASAYANPLLGDPAAGDRQVAFGLQGPNAHERALASAMDLIPAQASVLTTSHLFPELSDRPDAYVVNNETGLPVGLTIRDAVGYWMNQSDFVALDYRVDPDNAVIYQDYAAANFSDFGVRGADNGAYIFERAWNGPPSIWSPWTSSWAGGQLSLLNGSASGQFASSQGPSFYHTAGGMVGQELWAGPGFLYLPPGEYTIAFSLELLAPQSGSQLRLEVRETPLAIADSILFTHSGYSFHQLSLHRVKGNFTLLNQTKLVTQVASSQFVPVVVQMNFNWTVPGYLYFPGIELSVTMSVYLSSVQVFQRAALT